MRFDIVAETKEEQAVFDTFEKSFCLFDNSTVEQKVAFLMDNVSKLFGTLNIINYKFDKMASCLNEIIGDKTFLDGEGEGNTLLSRINACEKLIDKHTEALLLLEETKKKMLEATDLFLKSTEGEEE